MGAVVGLAVPVVVGLCVWLDSAGDYARLAFGCLCAAVGLWALWKGETS